MNLKCETILDFYTHNNRKILCQIKVLPSKSHKLKNTCRSLSSDQWNTFDKEMEKLLDGMKSSEDGNKENLGKFTIKPNIEVTVQKSKLCLKYFCKFLSTNGDCEKDFLGNAADIKDVAVVLECMLNLQNEAILALSNKPQEYEPSLDGNLSTSLMYEPYTPSKTKYCTDDINTVKTPGIELLNYNDDTYSPQPLFEAAISQSLDEIIPKYKPAPIKENIKTKNKKEIFARKSKEEYIPEAQKVARFDIPAYIPTPIDWSSAQKETNIFCEKPNTTFENKKLRRRSKTVDVMPKDLPIIFGNKKPKVVGTKYVEPLNENILNYKPLHIKENRSSRDSNKSDNKCLNEVINETDDETVPSLNDRPLRLKSKKHVTNGNEIDVKTEHKEPFVTDMQTNICLEKEMKFTNEPFEEFNELSEILPYCNNKNIKRRSKTLDTVPKEVETDNEKIIEEDKKSSISELNSRKSKEKKKDSNKISKDTNGKEKKSEEKPESSPSEDENVSEKSKKTKKHEKTHSKESGKEFENTKQTVKEHALSSPELNTKYDASPTRKVRSSKNSDHSNTASLRRSDRSPNKPKRFIEEIIGADPKRPKKIKISPKHRELFGSDDDDDEDEENDNDFESNIDNKNISKKAKIAAVFETPVSKKPTKSSLSSSCSSGKKKRKSDSASDCEQEKRDLSKWLSKKKTSHLDTEAGSSKVSKKSQRSKSPLTKSSKKLKSSKTPTDSKDNDSESATNTGDNFDMPSKKELEEIRNKSKIKQKENEKLKAELDKMRATPPKEVENMSLQDMSIKDILDTFTTYKNELDEIYKKNYKRDYIKGHEGINHCFVIHLLDQNVQMKMLEKLTDVYSNQNNSLQATLYANALLPEWIIRVYMEKFKFTREEAINQIKAQDDYRLHLEEQNDGTFVFS